MNQVVFVQILRIIIGQFFGIMEKSSIIQLRVTVIMILWFKMMDDHKPDQIKALKLQKYGFEAKMRVI